MKGPAKEKVIDVADVREIETTVMNLQLGIAALHMAIAGMDHLDPNSTAGKALNFISLKMDSDIKALSKWFEETAYSKPKAPDISPARSRGRVLAPVASAAGASLCPRQA